MTSDDTKQVKIKKEITPDFVLELYNDIKDMTDPEEIAGRKAVVDALADHLGEWLVVDDKDD
tara:strand:+ start:551 stop:736 length:186 start_codon:yes stop_codon:yes gene_type:complete